LIRSGIEKIWDRKPSKLEVIGRCGCDEKKPDHAEPTKVEQNRQKLNAKNVEKDILLTVNFVNKVTYGTNSNFTFEKQLS